MKPRVLIATGALCGMVALAGCGGSSYGSAAPKNAHNSKLMVQVTTTTRTWGTVRVSYNQAGAVKILTSCASSSCSYSVPRGALVMLSQSAASASTWPFKDWSLHNGSQMSTTKSGSLRFRIAGPTAVAHGVYVLSTSSSTGSGW